jgi:transcriptional regulator with XRE-family HTH domain
MPERGDREDEARKALGALALRLRSDGGWTQAMIAERAGITEQYLRRIERGTENPSLTTLIALARALGISTSQLVREVEESVTRS